MAADMRKSLFDYDQVLNTQRDKVYAIRRQALLSADLAPLMMDFSTRTMDDILEVCIATRLCISQYRMILSAASAGASHETHNKLAW